MTFFLPGGRHVRPASVPVLRAVCSVSLSRSLQTSPNAGPTVAPLPLGISVDTGTLERVAKRSPDSVATVDPCDPGTDPRNGPFAGIPHGDTFLTWTSTVTCPRLWWYAATSPTLWPRSGSGHRLLPVGVQRLLFTVVLAVVTFPFVSLLNAD